MNSHRFRPDDAVADRHVELLLQETLAGSSAPDVTARVAAAFARGDGPADVERLSASGRGPRRGFGLLAALLGLVVVLGVGYASRSQPESSEPEGARPGMPQGPAQERPLGPEVTVTTMAEIAALPADTDNVRLRLHTADAVRALTRLRKLRRLDAAFELEVTFSSRRAKRPDFFPAAAEPLGMLTSLEELDLSGHGPIKGLGSLETLARLRRLRIYYALMEPRSLGVLSKLPRLEHLHLEATLSTDADAPLLDLDHPEYGLATFAGSGRLRTLTLTACIADLEGMQAVATNPLEELRIYGLSAAQPHPRRQSLGAEAYVPLGGIRTLRHFSFQDTCSPELFAGLLQCEHLETLNLGSADGLQGREAGRAIARLTQVKSVTVAGSSIDHEALIGLTESKTIVDLALGGDVECTDSILARVAKMPALRRLTLPLSHSITDAGMAVLAATKLEHFALPHPEKITSAGLRHLPRSLTSLIGEAGPFDASVLDRLDNLTEAEFFFHYDRPLSLVPDLLTASTRTSLRKLTLAVDLRRLQALERLAELEGVELLDASKSLGELPADAVRRLRERSVEVRLPSAREPAPIEVMEVKAAGPGRRKK
ncbi:MAG: hypothetical protein NXI31_02620 [bacterium]|nr:hypothetical protein [bacterium]